MSNVIRDLTLEQSSEAIIVPRTALQMIEGETVVFVQTEAGFEPRHVETGRVDDTHVEILHRLVGDTSRHPVASVR